MALWVCRQCGCRFAVGLRMCPQCTAEDVTTEEEAEMAKISVHGGPSNADAEAAEQPADDSQATDYGDLTKPQLQDELERRGLPKSGNVAELVKRLEDDDTQRATAEQDADAESSQDGD
jgi:hypothetical protein